MKGFWEKNSELFDEDDAIRFMGRRFDGYAQSGRGGGQSGQGGGQSYHINAEAVLKNLAGTLLMIEDFFAEKGLDPRSYMESHRRGR